MKKKIALLAGGNSSEYQISINSAGQVAGNLDRERYDVYTIIVRGQDWYWEGPGKEKRMVDKNDFSLMLHGEKIRFDCAFIAIHGTPGEDGILQAYFDLTGIPYTGSGRLTSSVTFNKYFCKKYLESFGILTAPSILVSENSGTDIERIVQEIGFPCFVKPNEGGSSFGVSRVNNRDSLTAALDKALAEDTEILVESYIQGTEVTCGLVKGRNREMIFPPTEIISKKEFFDYEAKYVAGMSDEITPARISPEHTGKCQELSSGIYSLLQCRGVVRIDYILKGDDFYFLEVNTVPGMSAESIVPKMAGVYGIELKDLYAFLIEEAMSDRQA